MTVSLDTQEIGDFAAFAERRGADWQRIASVSDRATVFQTWEWVASWWKHHGQGKRFVGLAVVDAGAVVGCAALFGPGALAPLRTLRVVGNGGSDYLDFLALPGFEARVADAISRYLEKTRRSWDWVDLQQIRPGSLVASDLANVPAPGLRAARWIGETCPYLALPSDWETFRQGLSKKLRQNVGYYGRALEKSFVVEIRTATEETLADDLESFFFLHQRRWNQRWMPGAFASRRERAFHSEAAARLLASGMLRLHTLSLDGETQAALYCFQKDTRCCYYLGGFEPKFARWSIGTVLTAHAIRYAIERDRAAEFDFLRGDEAYKYKWGAVDRFNQRVSITHLGVRPAILAASGKVSLYWEHRLKSYMHARHAGNEKTPAGKKSKNA